MSIESDSFSAYAPIRQRGMMWWRYAQAAAKEGHISSEGLISSALPSMIEQNVALPYVANFHQVVKGQENADYQVMVHIGKMMMLRDWIPLAGQYELCGRQIFDLHDALVEMLGKTDLGDCTLEDWNAPYDAFYVRFGKQELMKLPFDGDEFEYLDGAYVARTPYAEGGHRLKLGFTTVKASGKGVGLPGYFIDLFPGEQKMVVADAIEAALSRKLAEYDAEDAQDPEAVAINSHRRQEARDSADLLRAGAALLVNAMFYLEGLGADAPQLGPGRDTPPNRVARWFQLDATKRRKEKSALNADGYAVVRLVGSEVVSGEARSAGGSPKTHWRRGHWRFQRHGEGLGERKRIWIKPVLVGAGNHDGSELPGHVYVGAGQQLAH